MDSCNDGTDACVHDSAGANGLAAVDLCINGLDSSVDVTVNIRSGTADSPGAILQSGEESTGDGFQWLRVPIDPVLALVPGTKYVIEAAA